MTTTTSSIVKVPKVLWAQRSDVVYITIEVVEAQGEQVELTNEQLSFTAIQGNTGDKYSVDTEQRYWSRLLKTGKPHYVHTDFGRWKDEDEVDEEPSAEMPGMGGMGGMMGGMGGMGGMDFSQFSNMAGSGGFPMGGEDEEEEEEDGDFEGEEQEGGKGEENDEDDPYQKTSKDALKSDD